jgi:hypothetical protein
MWSYCTSAHSNERCLLQHNMAFGIITEPVLGVEGAVGYRPLPAIPDPWGEKVRKKREEIRTIESLQLNLLR